ncbi:hypothetical protein LG3211_3215 [Lysobacter gummosus]|nr:hypothetical protein LG3211_3215 [Lysobacter gummosus]
MNAAASTHAPAINAAAVGGVSATPRVVFMESRVKLPHWAAMRT